jgi:hypothetical protein
MKNFHIFAASIKYFETTATAGADIRITHLLLYL